MPPPVCILLKQFATAAWPPSSWTGWVSETGNAEFRFSLAFKPIAGAHSRGVNRSWTMPLIQRTVKSLLRPATHCRGRLNFRVNLVINEYGWHFLRIVQTIYTESATVRSIFSHIEAFYYNGIFCLNHRAQESQSQCHAVQGKHSPISRK